MTFVLAHGIGGVRDLPVPTWMFYYGGAIVLIVSFVALGVLWRTPALERRAGGRPLGPRAQRVLLGPELRVTLGVLSAALLGVVFAAALVGEDSTTENLAPIFVYVLFWLGMVPLVVLLGNVWSVLNPWRAVAAAAAWLSDRLGTPWTPPLQYPERVGRWPAAFLLFSFAALELAYPSSADPRSLAVAIALYSWITWLGMAMFGRAAWLANGEAFSVYFGLLARIAPFALREEQGRRLVVVRAPFSGLAGRSERPGTVAFIAVMLGSVAFDGLSRTTWWQERVLSVQTSVGFDRPQLLDIAVTWLNVAGLVGMICGVALAYLLAVDAARASARRSGSLADDFSRSLVPIALAYTVAHYFSFFVIQGLYARRLVSDPFGSGWDLFGTQDVAVQLGLLSPNLVWYVQVGALVVGHVLGLAVAHDRAVSLFRSTKTALRTQYAMLALMVLYTVGGMWLLSSG